MRQSLLLLFISYTLPVSLIIGMLLGNYDFPFLPTNSSEKLWIYVSEFLGGKKLLEWPSRNIILENALYIERLIPRFFTWTLSSGFIGFLMLDWAVSLTCIFAFIFWFKSEYRSFMPAVILCFSPIYFIKLLAIEGIVAELWFARNCVAIISFILIFFLIHDVHKYSINKKSFFLLLLLSLTHSYVFLLGCISLIMLVTYQALSVNSTKRRIKFFLYRPRNIAFLVVVGLAIFLVFANNLLMRDELSLRFFWDRYTPKDLNLLFHNMPYYLSYYIIAFCCKLLIINANTKALLSIFLTLITGAVLLDLILFQYNNNLVNIHSRIYVIEHVLILLVCCTICEKFGSAGGRFLLISQYVFFSILLINLVHLVYTAEPEDKYQSIHKFIISENFATCDCSIYSPNAEDYFDSLSFADASSDRYWQWRNATYHLKQ